MSLSALASPFRKLFSGKSKQSGNNRSTRRKNACAFESLEQRTMLTINFVFNYSLDAKKFFNTQERKDALVYAGKMLGERLTDTLSAITPSGSNRWTATITDPATGKDRTFTNLKVAKNTIVVYVGGRDLSDLGIGGSRGRSWSGSSSWGSTVTTRGQSGAGLSKPTDTAPAVGSIAFDTVGRKWHFGRTTSGLASNEVDFISVAMHELTHILGINNGSKTSWRNLISSGTFRGTKTKAVNNNKFVPVDSGLAHFKEGTKYEGIEAAMDPTLRSGARKFHGPIDFAALDDIGWSISTNNDTIYRADHKLTHIEDPVFGSSSSLVLNSSIASSKDVNIYRIYATAKSRISIRSKTTSFDSYLKLFDASGKLLKSGDQAARSGTDSISYTLPRTDYYFVAVSSYGNRNYSPTAASSGPGGTTGSYRLTITVDDPVAARAAAGAALTANATTSNLSAKPKGSSELAGNSANKLSETGGPHRIVDAVRRTIDEALLRLIDKRESTLPLSSEAVDKVIDALDDLTDRIGGLLPR